MAMATQASLFTPTLSGPKSADRVVAPWKQSLAQFSTPKPMKVASAVAHRPIRAMAEEAPPATKEPEAPAGFTPPELDPNTPSPIFGGSTGGLLRKAQVEEFYVITWESPKEQVFEMPTGGAAIMRQGPNLLKLARKEQCLALGTRLRSKYKIKYQFYRVFPNGEVQYLHPKDGVYPEKVNAGRTGVGQNMQNMRSIGKNVSPIEVKFTGKQVYDL
ncbi:photosystem I reaction center subunit II, chloroplastic-like [Sesamum indicum]|uniref:Photosystem I reaction center subunit II, chloroplastic n=1 Tax=Sesamum indicum TaxID=4182 RepID=A0A6I9TUU4_SESIN|nr:photosystem I reaction center subunit II, chloroplastic-like [Sesamum indicum]